MSEDISKGITLSTADTTPEIIEPMIFKLLFQNKDFRSTLVPYLKPEIFAYEESANLIKIIDHLEETHGQFPTMKDIRLATQNKNINELLDKIVQAKTEDYSHSHLISTIEYYIRKSMFSQQVTNIITDMQDPNYRLEPEDILPETLREIFSFSFDNSVGLNLFSEEGIAKMLDFFHEMKKFIPSGIKGLDKCLAGGFHAKSLSLVLAPTNQGKSAIMGAIGANQVLMGKNVLYVTLEMSEEMIAQRIMANIFGIEQDKLGTTDKTTFMKKFEKIKHIIADKFRVKNFSTGEASSNRIRKLIKEYEIKQGFKPDVLIVDYLALMKPNRTRKVSQKHEDLQQISEELRDIGNDLDIPVISAMQTTREGFNATNLDLDNMSASFGVAMTADFVWAAIMTEELKAANQYLWIVVKNRFGQNGQEFYVGMDFSTMTLSDLGDMPRARGEDILPFANTTTDELLEEVNKFDDTDDLYNINTSGAKDDISTNYNFD